MHKSLNVVGYSKAVEIVNAINLMGGKAKLGQTYMDYGAGITWETILVHSKSLDMDYQALNPRDFDELNEGKLSTERAKEIVDYAIKD
jgi:hypothetical protein